MLQIQGQSNEPPKYSGPLDCAKKIFAENGIKGLYKGTILTLMRDIPGSIGYYAGYDLTKSALTKNQETPGVLTIL